MNDRFRFRIWFEIGKKYAYFGKPIINIKGLGRAEGTGLLFEILPGQTMYLGNNNIEQCTGLKDKNCRLIYEGDIVCWTRAQTDGDVDSICPIVFDNDMCSFGPLLNGHSLWMPHQTDLRMEVLGNIHENPELLEE